MPNENALYHLRKIIALRREEQRHIDLLKKQGIVLYDAETTLIDIISGKDKLGLPTDEAGDCEYMGALII